jgi:biotin carboxyl carrier protein
LPDKNVAVSKPVDADDTPVPEPRSHVGLLLFVLVIVLLGAGAAYYWFFVRNTEATEGATKPATNPATTKPTKPAPPPPPTAKLVASEPEVEEVKATADGVIAEIQASGSVIEADDVVVKFEGIEAIQKKIDEYESRQKYYEDKLAKAASPAAQKAAQAKVDEKKQLADEERAKLAAFEVKAPAAGTLATELAAKAAVKQGDVLFRVEGPSGVEATFTAPKDKTYTQGGAVKVAPKGGAPVTCSIAAVAGDQVTVECDADSGLAAGTEVELK